MGFAEEFAQSKVAPTETPKETPATVTPEEHFNQGMPEPKHGDVHPEIAAAAVIKPEDAVTPPPKEGKIRIGSEVFDSQEEALAYAQELQVTVATKDAFEMGKQSATPKTTTEEKDAFDEIEAELFEKPKEALKKLYNLAKTDARSEIRQEDAQLNARKEMWADFYATNQDLVENQELVGYVLDKNLGEIGKLPTEKALKILADKTRSLLVSKKVTALPSRELPSAKTVTTSATGVATATVAEKKATPMDFISQLMNDRRRSK